MDCTQQIRDLERQLDVLSKEISELHTGEESAAVIAGIVQPMKRAARSGSAPNPTEEAMDCAERLFADRDAVQKRYDAAFDEWKRLTNGR
jgi:hypothetical protein